jgi:hypothetical protein
MPGHEIKRPLSRMRDAFASAFFSLSFLLLAFTLIGCDRFFGHDEQVKDPLTMQEQGLSCVRSIGPDLRGFLAGQDRDPVKSVQCLSGALSKFAANTKGANPDGWTRGELSSFFEKYFKEESQARNTSEPFSTLAFEIAPFDADWVAQAKRRSIVTELFRWKAALFGGGEATLSRVELERIRTILEKVSGPLEAWRGQGRILSFAASLSGQSADIPSLERLTKSIRQVGEIFANELATNTGQKKIVREPMKLASLSDSLKQAGLDVLESRDRQQLVGIMKSIILAGDRSQIAGDEWSELARQATEMWISALRIQYGILQNSDAYSRDVDFVETTAQDILKSLARMVERHDGIISIEELRQLMTELENNRLLPKKVRAKSVNASFEAILGKLLGGNSLADKSELMKGLGQSQIERFKDVVHDWTEGQRIGIAIMSPVDFVTVDQAKISMSLIATADNDQVALRARHQMSELILRGRPLVHDPLGRLEISLDRVQGYRRTDLDALNITRVLMSAAMRGYSRETARAGNMPEINEAETQELFMDLKSIGRDLGIVDVRSLQSGYRTFMETNIFLSVSDGNAFISLHEMVEWFETVMGAGRVADQIHEDLVRDFKCGTNPVDVFGKQRLVAKCFRDNAAQVFLKRLSHLPNFVHALKTANARQNCPFFLQSFEKATRALGDSDLPVESSDIRAMSPVIHYVEALFTRYDANRSSILEKPEVWSVFPLIRPFIKKLAVDSTGKPIKLDTTMENAIFSWMLTFGEPPSGAGAGGITLYLYKWAMGLTNESAGFEDVVKILGSFAQVGREKKNKDFLAYYRTNRQLWENGIASNDKNIMTKTRELIQCSVEADVDLARLLQERGADIFAVDPKLDEDAQAEAVLGRMKSMVQANPQLQVLCLAF